MKQINIPKATRHIENPLCLILTVLLFALYEWWSKQNNFTKGRNISIIVIYMLFDIFIY